MLNLIANGTQVNRAIIFNFSSNNIPAGIFLNIVDNKKCNLFNLIYFISDSYN